jgi:inhibitor of KinA
MIDWQPLGDQAVLGYAPDEAAALGAAAAVRRQAWPWAVEVVQAYASIAVFYDADRVDFESVRTSLANLPVEREAPPGTLHVIPVCYEMGPDLDRVAEHTRLSRDEVIRQHIGAEYRVYAIGFCPGFPYLGYLSDELAGVPRLPRPRLEVPAGSVGLTGRQTGIYTEQRPGGWNLIGRTPLELVNVADGYFPLATGDRVRFEPIDKREFERLVERRLV